MPSVLRRSNRNVPARPEEPECHGESPEANFSLRLARLRLAPADFPAALIGIVICDRPPLARNTPGANRFSFNLGIPFAQADE
jgi:hypothetical protein